jgi:hypothetical protein
MRVLTHFQGKGCRPAIRNANEFAAFPMTGNQRKDDINTRKNEIFISQRHHAPALARELPKAYTKFRTHPSN